MTIQEMEHCLQQMQQQTVFLRQQVDHMEQQARHMSMELQAMKQTFEPVPPMMVSPVDRPAETTNISQPVDLRQKKKDMERFVGQSVMGVLAALLIFISMAVFAAMVLPSLPVGVRMVLLYLVSIGMTVCGLWLVKRKSNAITMTVTGIGCGGVYLSVVMTKLIWFMEPSAADIPVYLALLLWCAGLFYLARRCGGPFEAIAHTGIVVTFVFQLTAITGFRYNMNHPAILLLVVFVAMTEIAGLIGFHKKGTRFQPAVVSMAFVLLFFMACSMMIMLWGMDTLYLYDIDRTGNSMPVHLWASCLVLLPLTLFISYYCTRYRKRRHWTGLIQELISCFSMLVLAWIMADAGDTFVFSVLAMIFVILLLRHDVYTDDEFSILGTISVVLLYAMMSVIVFDSNISMLLLIPVVAMARGRKDVTIASLVLMTDYTLRCLCGEYAGDKLCMLLPVSACAVLLYETSYEKEKGGLLHGLGYLYLVLTGWTVVWFFVGCIVPLLSDRDLVAAIYAVSLHAVMTLAVAGTRRIYMDESHWDGSARRAFSVCMWIVHGFVLLVSLYTVYACGPYIWLHIPSILMAILCFVYRTQKWFEKPWGGFYVGLKFLLLCRVVLSSFQAPSYLASIVFFLMAATAVGYGFWKNVRALRMFGLVLSCLSVCKLVLLDVQYESSLMKAVSFFICGCICLGINFIYSRINGACQSGKGVDTE